MILAIPISELPFVYERMTGQGLETMNLTMVNKTQKLSSNEFPDVPFISCIYLHVADIQILHDKQKM